MEQIVSENLVKTQKVVVKDADTEEVKYERNLTSSPKLRTMSAVSEDVTLVSGESATYYDEYNNIQDLKNAIIENYPEKDDEEVAKDILRALDQDEDVINSMITSELEKVLYFELVTGASEYISELAFNNEMSCENTQEEIMTVNAARTPKMETGNQGLYDEDALKTYTLVAYYGKNSNGNHQFYSYATVKWLTESSDKYTDVIAIASSAASLYGGIEGDIVNKGMAGFISYDYSCNNVKEKDHEEAPEYIPETKPYGTVTGSRTYNALKEAGNYTLRDSNLLQIEPAGTSVFFEAPYPVRMGSNRCGAISYEEGWSMVHNMEKSNSKYFVSGYFLSNNTTYFQGTYFHTKKDYKVTYSAGISGGVSITGKGVSVSLGASLGANFAKQYIKKTFYTPYLVAEQNSQGNIVSIKPV